MIKQTLLCVTLVLGLSTSLLKADTVYDLGTASLVVPDMIHNDIQPLSGSIATTGDKGAPIDVEFAWGGETYSATLGFLSQSGHIVIGGTSIAPSITNYNGALDEPVAGIGALTVSMFAEQATPVLGADTFFDNVNATLVTFVGLDPLDTRYGTISEAPLAEVPNPTGFVIGLMGFISFGCFVCMNPK